MAEHSPKGLPTHFGDELLEAFPQESRKTLGLRWPSSKPTGS
jgi:hypothetical protein